MISPHPGHRSKEVISNNAPSQILQGEGGFLFKQRSFPGFCLAGKRPVGTGKIHLPSSHHTYVPVALKGAKGRVGKKCSVTANLSAQQRIRNHK